MNPPYRRVREDIVHAAWLQHLIKSGSITGQHAKVLAAVKPHPPHRLLLPIISVAQNLLFRGQHVHEPAFERLPYRKLNARRRQFVSVNTENA